MSKFSIALTLFATGLTAQATWTVDPSGNGDFTTIQAANQAAAVGDTLVLVGTMPGATLSKRLNIVAHNAIVTSALNVSATGGVSVSGGIFHSVTTHDSTISLDGLITMLTVSGTGDVAARECVFHPNVVFVAAATIGPNAQAVFDHCGFLGADAIPSGFFYPVDGTAGLRADGKVELRDCSINGGQWMPHPFLGGIPGGPAIDLGVASAHVDMKDCVMTSGAPFDLLHGTGSVRVENTNTGNPPASINIVTAELPWMTGTSAYAGGTMNINVDSTSATLATISASIGMRPPLPTVIGDVWLAPAYVPVTAGITDANGEIATTIAVPATVTRGLIVTFQGVVFPSSGGITATTPAILHVL